MVVSGELRDREIDTALGQYGRAMNRLRMTSSLLTRIETTAAVSGLLRLRNVLETLDEELVGTVKKVTCRWRCEPQA